MQKSISKISDAEFINLQPLDISPLISTCDIKVLYVGENDKHTFFSKEKATEMAKTLRGNPIVGNYIEDKKDFNNHDREIIIDDNGIRFSSLTKPYGFVAPDAKVWFQKFQEYDRKGQLVEKEYLMTQGYLWTGQFEEAQQILNNGGNPQSMELGDAPFKGHKEYNNGVEVFIIDDAIFSKLCILGHDVPPAFETAGIYPTGQYSLDIEVQFQQTLYSMMTELKEALSKGGQSQMPDTAVVNDTNIDNTPAPAVTEPVATEPVVEPVAAEPTVNTPVAAEPEPVQEPVVEPSTPEPTPVAVTETKEYSALKEELDTKVKEYSALEAKFNTLSAEMEQIKKDYSSLVEYKNNVEKSNKEKLIKSYSWLSDEDKKDVMENIMTYSYDDIKSKLSVMSVEKNMNLFTKQNITPEPVNNVQTYSLDGVNLQPNEPAWVTFAKSVEI